MYSHWLLDSFLYACVFLTSYLTIFTGLDTCVYWFLVEDLALFFSLIFVFVMVFFLILCLTFVLLRQKRGVFFCLFLDRECISKPFKYFLSQNGQMESLLVFYVGYILDDKNTLCNGYNLNRMIGFYSESSSNMNSVHFMPCVWSQVSRRCTCRFHTISKSEQLILVQPFGRAFEGVRTPYSV